MTLEELDKKITRLERQIHNLEKTLDYNDLLLREMIDALTESVNILSGITEEEVGGPYGAILPE